MNRIEGAERKQIAEIINRVITPEAIITNLEMLQPPAPSGTVLHTRTPVIKKLLLESGVPPEQFTSRFLDTRSPAVLFNNNKPLLWFSAHSDQPTYLLPNTNEITFDIMPISAHRPKRINSSFPEFPAVVLRYKPKNNIYEVVSEGIIGTQADNNKPYYNASTKPKGGFHPGYDRIVYAPPFTFDERTGLVTGNIDNAAGIAASIAAIKALVEIARQNRMGIRDFKLGMIFPDEEEGLEHDPAYFARGARRIVHRATAKNLLPEIIVNVDGHDTLEDNPPGKAAVYGAYVSDGKGPIVPPDIYAVFDRLLKELTKYGVITEKTEFVGKVSRSDDAGFMEVHDQIMPVGYLVRDPHHNKGLATANIEGLINTAMALAWITTEIKNNFYIKYD
ncbi:hypothetical protein L6272_00190 [Microgenomates group bacterium]|nr:hypothetical protein [Microgenomates group bacterium]